MKLDQRGELRVAPESLPSRERGLKFVSYKFSDEEDVSLPSRERGLKSSDPSATPERPASLPSRERGLK